MVKPNANKDYEISYYDLSDFVQAKSMPCENRVDTLDVATINKLQEHGIPVSQQALAKAFEKAFNQQESRTDQTMEVRVGLQVHRAMGYGMPLKQFESLALTKPNYEKDETIEDLLYATFKDLTEDDLTIPANYSFKGAKPHGHSNLMYTWSNTDQGCSTDLFLLAGHSDDKDRHVVFFPNIIYSRQWYRYDDNLDYHFERWRNSSESIAAPRDFVIYTRFGPYPFTNDLMLEDGTAMLWSNFWSNFLEAQNNPMYIAKVPLAIRWYLTKLGLLNDNGVNKLRPLLAQWWA